MKFTLAIVPFGLDLAAAAPVSAERYGPDKCIAAWRDSESGHCIMETDCADTSDLSVYEFGLLCQDKDGGVVRHLFGQDSFELKETFDTLITCEACRALDEYMDANRLIKHLSAEVSQLKDNVKHVTDDIQHLKNHVVGPVPVPAPAPAPAVALKAKHQTQRSLRFVAENEAAENVHNIHKRNQHHHLSTEQAAEDDADAASETEQSEDENDRQQEDRDADVGPGDNVQAAGSESEDTSQVESEPADGQQESSGDAQ